LSLESSLQFGNDFVATRNDRAEIVMDGFTPKTVGMIADNPWRRAEYCWEARFHVRLHVLGDALQPSRETGADQVQLDREEHRRHFHQAGLLQRRCASSPDGFEYADKLGLDSIHAVLRPGH
jgi:hypothetical protein